MWWRGSKWKGSTESQWKRNSVGRSCSESQWKRSSRSCSGKSTADLSGSSLDRSQHRCSSIESLLSLDQSLVTYDDKNNIRLIPLVCLEGNNIPAEVEIGNDNGEAPNANPIADNGNEESNVDDKMDANIGLDISEKTIVSESEGGEAEVDQEISLDHRPCQSDGRPLNTIDQGIQILNQSEEKEIEKPMKRMRSILKTQRMETLLSSSVPPRERLSDTTQQNSLVRFGVVEVHEHELELGSSVPLRGPPVGLGWKRESYRKFPSVDHHLQDTYHATGGPRPFNLLHQPSKQRVNKLLDLGYTIREIQSSAREAGIVRTKRIQSARYSSRNKCFVVFRKAVREFFLPLSTDHKKLGKKTTTSEYTKSAKTMKRSSILKRA